MAALAPGYSWRARVRTDAASWLTAQLELSSPAELAAVLRQHFPAEHGASDDTRPTGSLSEACELAALTRARRALPPLDRQRVEHLAVEPAIGKPWSGAPVCKDLRLAMDQPEYQVAQRIRRNLAVFGRSLECQHCHEHSGRSTG